MCVRRVILVNNTVCLFFPCVFFNCEVTVGYSEWLMLQQRAIGDLHKWLLSVRLRDCSSESLLSRLITG